MQLSYQTTHTEGMDGSPADVSEMDVETGIALEDLAFGIALFRSQSSSKTKSVRPPKLNRPVLVWSGDLVASNVINGSVNGVALSPITYATSHLATMTTLCDAIVAALLAQGIVATYALSNSNRTATFTVVDANAVFASFIVTGGAGQATSTLTNGTSDSASNFVGFARFSSQPPRRSDGLNGYASGDAVGVIRKGRFWAPLSANCVETDALYADLTSGSQGKVTPTTTSPNIALTRGAFRGTFLSANGRAKVEINLP